MPFKPLSRDKLKAILKTHDAIVLFEDMMTQVGEEIPLAMAQLVRKDTLTTRGDIFVRDASTVVRLGIGSASRVLQSDGTDALWQQLTSVSIVDFAEAAQDAVGNALADTATINLTYTDGTGAVSADLIDHSVSDAKLRDSAALSVIGRAANSTGNPSDIVAGSDGHVLRRAGTTLGFGTITTAGIANDAVTNSLLADMAQATIKGRASGAGTGDPTDLTGAEVATIIGYTAADVLTKLLTVDGSGSGLDADLLDGISSAGFLQTSTYQALTPTWTGPHIFTKSGGGSSPAIYINAQFPFLVFNDPTAGVDLKRFQIGVAAGVMQLSRLTDADVVTAWMSYDRATDILLMAAATIRLNTTTATTVGAAGAAAALPVLPLGYITANVNGTAMKIPYYNT